MRTQWAVELNTFPVQNHFLLLWNFLHRFSLKLSVPGRSTASNLLRRGAAGDLLVSHVAEQFWLVLSRVAAEGINISNSSLFLLPNRSYSQMRTTSHVCKHGWERGWFSLPAASPAHPPHPLRVSSFLLLSVPTFCSPPHVHKPYTVMIPTYFCCHQWAFMEERGWSTIKNCDCTLMQHRSDWKMWSVTVATEVMGA